MSTPLSIGFGKARLTEALDLSNSPKSSQKNTDESKYALERKFDVTDRVKGLWRPDEAGQRKVVEDLWVRAMAGEDKNGPWVVLSFDLCTFSYLRVDLFREPLVRKLGYRPERVLCLPTHCHMTVKFHDDKLMAAVLQAVLDAQDNSAPAEMAVLSLTIDAEKYVINRRVHVDGVGTRTIMFNDLCEIKPDHMVVTEQIRDWIKNLGGNPGDHIRPGTEIVTHGTINPLLQGLFFRHGKSKDLLGSFINFASHPVIVSEKKVNGDISADYPGYLRKRLEEKLDGVAIFAQGASGDLRPLIREYSHAFAKEYGHALAEKLLRGWDTGMEWKELTEMHYDTEPVSLPLRKDLPATEQARQEALVRIEKEFDREKNIEKRRKLQNLFWFYCRAAGVRDALRPEWIAKKKLPVSLYALRLNEAALLACHGEIFSATRAAMVAPFAAKNPLFAGICNEYISYFPTLEDFERGGYEPSVCVAEPGSTDIYVEGAHRLLRRIYGA